MKPLPASFRHSGYDLTLVERTAKTAIYHKTKPGWAHKAGHYEAIIIRTQADSVTHWGHSPAHEAYPSNEQWGILGWSLPTLQAARDKLSQCHSLHRGCEQGGVISP